MEKIPQNFSQKSITYQSFEILYRKFTLPLMKFLVRRMGGNQQAAEEVFSQTVLAAWQGWQTFEHKATFFTWICRIGLNKIADYYRDQIHQQSKLIAPGLDFLAQISCNQPSVEESIALVELRKSVYECLLLLPVEKRQLLYFKYWKDMSLKAIAEILGISERAAEGKLYRARLAFREVLTDKYPMLLK